MIELGGTSGLMDLVFNSDQMRANRKLLTTRFLKAAYEAVAETARELEKDFERATAAAGLGRLEKAWQSKVYPKRGLAYAPSADIFASGVRARQALAAYSTGGSFRRGSGQFFAIPTKAAGVRYTGRAKKFLTPGEWERRTGLKLRLIYRRSGPSFLVTDGITSKKSGTIARAATQKRLAQGRETLTIVIFLLIPKFDVRKRFSIDTIKAPYAGRLRANFIAKARAIGAATP